LEEEIAILKNKKNSHNSHQPPSKDKTGLKKIKVYAFKQTLPQAVSQGMKVKR